MTPHILAHLEALDPAQFVSLEDADAFQTIGAQAATAQEILMQMGSPEHVLRADQAQQVRDTFGAILSPALNDVDKKAAVLSLRAPQAVRHLTGMLSAFDWAYVEHVNELRGYVVAKLLEETKHPDAKIRLRALEQLGKVTEVGVFTERIEVKKTEISDAEIDAKIKEKINRFMGVIDVADVSDAPVLESQSSNAAG